MAGHSLAGFVMAGVTGALLAVHIRIGWRRGLNRISGCGLLVLLALMLVSALGIFYLGDERLSRCSSIAHSGAGLCAAPLFIWHMIRGRRLRLDASLRKHPLPVTAILSGCPTPDGYQPCISSTTSAT